MRSTILKSLAAMSALAIGTAAGGAAAVAVGGGSGPSPSSGPVASPVCGAVKPGFARCNAWKLNNPSVNWQGRSAQPDRAWWRTTTTTSSTTSSTSSSTSTSTTTSTTSTSTTSTTTPTSTSSTTSSTTTTLPPAPKGYGPGDLQAAYGLTGLAPSGSPIVAIVDAYDDPNAESDLGVYRSQYGLVPCTTANGCFRKVNQSGGTSYPAADPGWSQEISLDLDMVSAICSGCRIVLVEASSNSYVDLGTAVNEAVALGAVAVSNSYGGGEFNGETTYDSYYNHPGVAITASSGDNGYGVEYPAASQYVTSVGGTSLTQSSGVYSETAWSGAGSGCSGYEPKPSWQTDSGCSRRTVADVSAVANPNTGVAVYDTYGGPSYGSGWMVFGGTSVASPIVASVYALAGNTASLPDGAGHAYSNKASLHDVSSGSNGNCGGSYLCTSVVGYDGPTGLGTPNGVGAF